MARQFFWAVAVLSALGGAPAEAALCPAQEPAKAQQPRDERREPHREPFDTHPRYPWWKDDKARTAAGFSAEQAVEIERVFREEIEKSRPLREEVTRLQKQLNDTIAANVAEVAVFARQVEKVETKRAELNRIRMVMLYRMARVLTPEQNTKLLAYFERREAERRKSDGDRHR